MVESATQTCVTVMTFSPRDSGLPPTVTGRSRERAAYPLGRSAVAQHVKRKPGSTRGKRSRSFLHLRSAMVRRALTSHPRDRVLGRLALLATSILLCNLVLESVARLGRVPAADLDALPDDGARIPTAGVG